MAKYHVSEPNSYLAVTGANIDKVKIVKKAIVWPFQKVTKISITPFDFSMSLQAMTSEKLQFALPAVFTIGPRDDVASLEKYAVLLTGDSDGQVKSTRKGTVATGRNHVQDIVKGIIEGETRSLVSNMTMEELFNNRRIFKAQVTDGVQKELDQFGLMIYNANVKELQDMGDSRYFESLARKAHEGAQSQAQVDVANARMVGRIGEAEKEGETKQKIAKIDATTAVEATKRKIEKANADATYKTREIEIGQEINLQQIAAQRAAEQRDAELQKGVEEKRAEMELERLRATTVTQAKIARESAQERADADLYSSNKSADAKQYNQRAEAEAVFNRSKRDAEAALNRSTREAEAALFKKAKDAEAFERDANAALFKKAKDAEALERDAKAGYFKRTKDAEASERDADADYFKRTKDAEASERDAEAELFRRMKDAEANERDAEATFFTKQKEAEAHLIAQKKEAEGLLEMSKAYGALANVLGGPQGLMQYLMLQNNTFEKLAAQNAKAINGLQPKINVWTTGNQDGADSTAPIRNLFQTLPPLFSTIQDQTGMQPPAWLARMPQGEGEHVPHGQSGQNGQMTAEEKQAKQQKMLNGRK